MSLTPALPRTADAALVPGWPTGSILLGCDYNPEQWDRAIWRDDIRLMRELGVDLVAINIFGWAHLEPRDGEHAAHHAEEQAHHGQEDGQQRRGPQARVPRQVAEAAGDVPCARRHAARVMLPGPQDSSAARSSTMRDIWSRNHGSIRLAACSSSTGIPRRRASPTWNTRSGVGTAVSSHSSRSVSSA